MRLCGTTAQLRALDALIAYGGVKEAAWHLRCNERLIRRRVQELRDANGMTTSQLAFYRGLDTREEAA